MKTEGTIVRSMKIRNISTLWQESATPILLVLNGWQARQHRCVSIAHVVSDCYCGNCSKRFNKSQEYKQQGNTSKRVRYNNSLRLEVVFGKLISCGAIYSVYSFWRMRFFCFKERLQTSTPEKFIIVKTRIWVQNTCGSEFCLQKSRHSPLYRLSIPTKHHPF